MSAALKGVFTRAMSSGGGHVVEGARVLRSSGGNAPFPSPNLPWPRTRQITFVGRRGPPGWLIVGGTLSLISVGIYVRAQDNVEQNYAKLARFARRYEEVVLIQAREEPRYKYVAEKKLRWERELMKHVPGWDAGRAVYLTQKAPQPRKNHFTHSGYW